ncbi:hypothetical protein BUALT_Bualt03G0222200 [Buddleja alternifolia]|uniref:HTH myb-type domain-containing protein n=1 Tax=Buddleja alternifolia TaxID=168488 RepID=A0AAV6Y338_9LAMI|nr:hypothetical protein BUALT_Bualt03G0222200 [Buddleja alternifolia]
MENFQKIRVRQYIKSSVPRLRWTPELHDHFVEVVHNLGGRYRATPAKIMQMMAVKGLKISQIKSHLQMYRRMKEHKDLKGFIAINNYQEKKLDCTTWLPLWKFPQGLREPPPHKKPIGQFTCQTRRKIVRNGENVYYHEYQVEGTQGSTTSATKERAEIPRANTELQGTSEINFLGLSSLSPINLDLTMSLY